MACRRPPRSNVAMSDAPRRLSKPPSPSTADSAGSNAPSARTWNSWTPPGLSLQAVTAYAPPAAETPAALRRPAGS